MVPRTRIDSSSARAWLIAFLVFAEVWLLRQRFTTDVLLDSHQWWAPLVRAGRFNVPWGLSVVGATLAVGWRRLHAEFERAQEAQPPVGARALAVTLLAHLAAFGLFFVLTGILLTRGSAGEPLSSFLPFPWAAVGALVLFSLGCLLLAPRDLSALLWRTRVHLASGLLAGTLAFLAARFVTTAWPFWEPLAHATLWLSNLCLGWFTSERVCDPEGLVLGTPRFLVHVTRACSGYTGMGLFTVFFVSFVALRRRQLSLARVWLLLPTGLLCAWILNGLRIAILIVIGDRISPRVAIEGFHVYAGWPLVIVVALGAVYVATRVAFFATVQPTPEALPRQVGRGVNPAAVFLGPLMASVGVSFLVGVVVGDDPKFYPLRVVAALLVLFLYRREYGLLRPSSFWMAPALGVLGAAVWIVMIGLADSESLVSNEPPWPDHPLAWGSRILGFVFVSPLCEELALRGFLARRIVSAQFELVDLRRAGWAPIVLPALVFGLLHEHVLAGTIVGLLFSLAVVRHGRIGDAVAAHATTNAVLAVVACATGNWSLWS